MSFKVTVTGKHIGCGGMTILCEDGIRLKCQKCGQEETWEQAAAHMSAELKRLRQKYVK